MDDLRLAQRQCQLFMTASNPSAALTDHEQGYCAVRA
jgi:hypothetical protein